MSYSATSLRMPCQWDRVKDYIVENFEAKYNQATPLSFEEADGQVL